MKSLIQWEHTQNRTIGIVKHCPTCVNVYCADKYFQDRPWFFTIRRHNRNIVVCHREYPTREAAIVDAAKFFIISILMDVHPKLGDCKNEHYTLSRVKSI